MRTQEIQSHNMLNYKLDIHPYVVLSIIHYRRTSNLGMLPIIFHRFFLEGFFKPLFFEFIAGP